MRWLFILLLGYSALGATGPVCWEVRHVDSCHGASYPVVWLTHCGENWAHASEVSRADAVAIDERIRAGGFSFQASNDDGWYEVVRSLHLALRPPKRLPRLTAFEAKRIFTDALVELSAPDFSEFDVDSVHEAVLGWLVLGRSSFIKELNYEVRQRSGGRVSVRLPFVGKKGEFDIAWTAHGPQPYEIPFVVVAKDKKSCLSWTA